MPRQAKSATRKIPPTTEAVIMAFLLMPGGWSASTGSPSPCKVVGCSVCAFCEFVGTLFCEGDEGRSVSEEPVAAVGADEMVVGEDPVTSVGAVDGSFKSLNASSSSATMEGASNDVSIKDGVNVGSVIVESPESFSSLPSEGGVSMTTGAATGASVGGLVLFCL